MLLDVLLNPAGLDRFVPALVAGLLSAAWWLGRYLNGRPDRVLLDPGTGQQLLPHQRHSLLFIPAQCWATPLAAAAAVAFVSNPVNPA